MVLRLKNWSLYVSSSTLSRCVSTTVKGATHRNATWLSPKSFRRPHQSG